MSKKRVLFFLILAVIGFIVLSVRIPVKKQELAELTFVKEGVPITNLEEVPAEAQKLILQYRKLEEQNISYMQISRNALIIAIILLGIQYLILVFPEKKSDAT